MFKEVNQVFLAALAVALALSGCGTEQTHASFSSSLHDSAAQPIEQKLHQSAQAADKQEFELTPKQLKTAGIKIVRVGSSPINGGILQLSSTVETAADNTAVVLSPVNGVVSRVLVDLGDRVRAGQVVAFVNSPDISDAQAAYLESIAKLSQSQAQLDSVKARLEISKAIEKRVSDLNLEGIAATKEVEMARSTRVAIESEEAAAVGAINAATAHLSASRVKLRSLGLNEPNSQSSERTASDAKVETKNNVTFELPIRSLVCGVVVRKDVCPGQSVGPGTASRGGSGGTSALLTIADLRKVWVMLEVPQQEVSDIKLGESINFKTESIPEKTFKGRITKLAESFDPQSRTAQVRAEIDNPGGLLKPGILVIASLARIHPNASRSTVPSSAVQTIDGRDVVFVSRSNEHFQARRVSCGSRSDSVVEIESGLNPGEAVVSSGAFYLKSELMRETISGGSTDE